MELLSLDLNIYFEITENEEPLVYFNTEQGGIHVNGTYPNKIDQYSVSGGIISEEILLTIENKLAEIKTIYINN